MSRGPVPVSPKSNYKFVDLSGYAFTGKTAVIDLLREFKGYYVPHFEYEFCLLRIQGGIFDLENALSSDWSPIRSDAAIRRFKTVIARVGTKSSKFKPSTWFASAGQNYDEHFEGHFFELSKRYIDSLVVESWRATWGYVNFDLCGPELFLRRALRKLGLKRAGDFEVCLAGPDGFVEKTKKYLRDLLSVKAGPDDHAIVMHNAFEPFNPERGLKFFDSAKCIVIDRDPRDNFVQQIPHPGVAVDVRRFIKRYRIYREITSKFYRQHPDVLRIRFEDLLVNYDRTVKGILAHLGEDEAVHVRKLAYFNPAVSVKNMGIWKNHVRPEEIELIYKELKEFCFEG